MKLFLCVAACATLCLASDQKLGQPLTLKEGISLSTLFAAPAPYVGKTVQVKARITEVCQMMGCWMNLTDDAGHLLRIKVDDGVIVFPKESVGKTALAEGKLVRRDLTREQAVEEAKEEAQEAGRKFDPSKIKSGKVVYELAGSGAVILDR